jgi:ankyrin repeat protein
VLLAKGSAVDSRDAHGQTALIFAALYGHAAILRQLAAAGAALHLECEAGLTAEQHATRAGHWECVRELRALGRTQALSSDRKRARRAATEDAWVLPEDI